MVDRQNRRQVLLELTEEYRTTGWMDQVAPPVGATEEHEKFFRQVTGVLEGAGIVVVEVGRGSESGVWDFHGYAPALNSSVRVVGTERYIRALLPSLARLAEEAEPAALAEIRRWIASEKGLV